MIKISYLKNIKNSILCTVTPKKNKLDEEQTITQLNLAMYNLSYGFGIVVDHSLLKQTNKNTQYMCNIIYYLIKFGCGRLVLNGEREYSRSIIHLYSSAKSKNKYSKFLAKKAPFMKNIDSYSHFIDTLIENNLSKSINLLKVWQYKFFINIHPKLKIITCQYRWDWMSTTINTYYGKFRESVEKYKEEKDQRFTLIADFRFLRSLHVINEGALQFINFKRNLGCEQLLCIVRDPFLKRALLIANTLKRKDNIVCFETIKDMEKYQSKKK